MSLHKTFVAASLHTFAKPLRRIIEAEGYHFFHTTDVETLSQLLQKKPPHCLVIEQTLLKQLCNGRRANFAERSFTAIMAPASQLGQVGSYIDDGYVHDFVLQPLNKGQLRCLLSKAKRHHTELRRRSRQAMTRSVEELVEKRLAPVVNRLEVTALKDLHTIVMSRIERPLIKIVLQKTKGNQLQAAKVLGMNRNTLRKKIKEMQASPDTTKLPRRANQPVGRAYSVTH